MTYHIRKAEKDDVTTAYLLERELFGEHSYPDFFFRQAYDCWSDGFLVAVTQSTRSRRLCAGEPKLYCCE